MQNMLKRVVPLGKVTKCTKDSANLNPLARSQNVPKILKVIERRASVAFPSSQLADAALH